MKYLLIIIGLLFVISCASVPPSGHKPEPGVQYVVASWYGGKFHGRQTSSGERFNMYNMTCAHKTYKFGTKLRVTNPDNNKSVVVTVNDRGPFIRGRDLDLSYGAAKKIGLLAKGVGRVKIEYLGRDVRYTRRIPYVPSGSKGYLTVQVGSFLELSRARRLKKGLDHKYDDVHIATVRVGRMKHYRVRIGKFNSHDNAYSVAKKLADEGYKTLIVAGE